MTQDISSTIDMDITEDMTMGELRELPLEERIKAEHEIAKSAFFKLTRQRSLQGIDILEGLNVNDYEGGNSRIEIPLGIALGCIKAMKMSMDNQARQEMQVSTERTAYGAELATASSDLLSALEAGMHELVGIQCEYFSVLYNRRLNRHLVNDAGDSTPFTDEELMRQQLMQQEIVEEK